MAYAPDGNLTDPAPLGAARQVFGCTLPGAPEALPALLRRRLLKVPSIRGSRAPRYAVLCTVAGL
jgi:hypothetical protein